jgi:hypothetical protein
MGQLSLVQIILKPEARQVKDGPLFFGSRCGEIAFRVPFLLNAARHLATPVCVAEQEAVLRHEKSG